MSIAIFGKKLALTVQAVAIAFGFSAFSLAAVTATPSTAFAVNCGDLTIQNGVECAKPKNAKEDLFAGNNSIFKTVANTLLFLVGAIAVIFLIIGGLRYVVSNGDPKNVTAAKDTILYAIIGIVVAILAFALVNFVVKTLA